MNILIAMACCGIGWLLVLLTGCKPVSAFFVGWGMSIASFAFMNYWK